MATELLGATHILVLHSPLLKENKKSKLRKKKKRHLFDISKVDQIIVIKLEPVIDSVKTLGHWVTGSTCGSLVELVESDLIK